MQHPRPAPLRHQPRHKRHHRPAATPHCAHRRQTVQLQIPRHQAREDSCRKGIDGPEQQANDRHGDGFTNGIGEEPDEELEGGSADNEGDDGGFLADFVGWMGQGEAADCDAGPEARRDVSNARGRGVPVGDEEGDDPAGNGDLGALVGEDEQGAEDGGFVLQCLFQQFGL